MKCCWATVWFSGLWRPCRSASVTWVRRVYIFPKVFMGFRSMYKVAGPSSLPSCRSSLHLIWTAEWAIAWIGGLEGLFQIFVLFHCLGSIQESGTDGCPMEKHIGRQFSWRWCHTEGSLGKHQAECVVNVARREQDGILGERGLCLKTEGQKSINVTWATAGESKEWSGLALLLMIQMKWMLALNAGLSRAKGSWTR